MAYGGHPTITNLTAITPVLTLSRASGPVPFVVQVHGADTTATFSDAGAAFEAQVGRAFDPYLDLEFTWDFGDAAGTETLTHPVHGTTVNANADQTGPEAAYVYRSPGSYTITLAVRGYAGSGYVTASATATVTVSAWSGTDRYFDSEYDGSNGASDGTTTRPYTTFADLGGWVQGASQDATDRRALVKRGSSFDATDRLLFSKQNRVRVEAYGSGAAPVLYATSGTGPLVGSTLYSVTDSEDVAFSGLEFRAGPAVTGGAAWFTQSENNAASGEPYNALRDYAFLDCTFAGPVGIGFQDGARECASRWTFWRCSFLRDATTKDGGQGLGVGVDSGLAVVGGSFSGGDGSVILDHHIYPTVNDHALYRWIDFGAAPALSFCINTNCRSDGVDVPHTLIDGCEITGTSNGTDASNSHNDPAEGQFDGFLVQGCAYHGLPSGAGQGLGFYSTCLLRAVLRDCLFWGNALSDVVAGDPGSHLAAYRNAFDGTEAESLELYGASYLAANEFGATLPPDPGPAPAGGRLVLVAAGGGRLILHA